MAERGSSSGEIENVRLLITSIRDGHRQDPVALAEAQERGFGQLMSLEVELQRAKRAASDAAGSSAEGHADALVGEHMHAISELSDALTELRDISCPSDGPSKVGYGFVLPARARPGTSKPCGA